MVLCLAIAGVASMIFASTILQSSGPGDVDNAGGDGALLYPTARLTQLAPAHARETTQPDTFVAEKATKHRPLVAGRHHPYITKGAG